MSCTDTGTNPWDGGLELWGYTPYGSGYRTDGNLFVHTATPPGNLSFSSQVTCNPALDLQNTGFDEDSVTVNTSISTRDINSQWVGSFVAPGSWSLTSSENSCELSEPASTEDLVLPGHLASFDYQLNQDQDEVYTHSYLVGGVRTALTSQRKYIYTISEQFGASTPTGTAQHTRQCSEGFPFTTRNYSLSKSVAPGAISYTQNYSRTKNINWPYQIQLTNNIVFDGIESELENVSIDPVNPTTTYLENYTYRTERSTLNDYTAVENEGRSCLYVIEDLLVNENSVSADLDPTARFNPSYDSAYSYLTNVGFIPRTWDYTPLFASRTWDYTLGREGQLRIFYADGAQTLDLGTEKAGILSTFTNIDGSTSTDLSGKTEGEVLRWAGTLEAPSQIPSQIVRTTTNPGQLGSVTSESATLIDTNQLSLIDGGTAWLYQKIDSSSPAIAYRCTISNLVFTDIPFGSGLRGATGPIEDRDERRRITEFDLTIQEIVPNAESMPLGNNTGRIYMWTCNDVWDLRRFLRASGGLLNPKRTKIKQSTVNGVLWECQYSRVDHSEGDNPTDKGYASVITLNEDGSIQWNPVNIAPTNAKFWKPEGGFNADWIKYSD